MSIFHIILSAKNFKSIALSMMRNSSFRNSTSRRAPIECSFSGLRRKSGVKPPHSKMGSRYFGWLSLLAPSHGYNNAAVSSRPKSHTARP